MDSPKRMVYGMRRCYGFWWDQISVLRSPLQGEGIWTFGMNKTELPPTQIDNCLLEGRLGEFEGNKSYICRRSRGRFLQ